MLEMFSPGDRVRFKHGSGRSLSFDLSMVYTIGAVCDLSRPRQYFVDPLFWDEPDLAVFRKLTRVQAYGHPQIVFLEGTRSRSNRPVFPDPEGLGRCGLSAAWFERVR